MDKMRFEESIAVTAGLFMLFALPAISHAQSALISSASTRTPVASGSTPARQPGNSSVSLPDPRLSGPGGARPTAQRDLAQIEDYIMSLTVTSDQKAQIGQIHQEMKNRMDLVAKDNNETIDQKEAMIDGLKRMRLREILLVLTPEQRSELRRKLSARSSSAPPQGTMVQQTPPK